MKTQQGFTLIELIVVIVILGILAATALPRFANLQGDARAASGNAALGSIRSAAAIAHGTFLARNTAAGATESIEGVLAVNTNGYPSAAQIAVLAGVAAPSYAIVVGGTTATITPAGATPGACDVIYNEATLAAGVVTPPTFTTVPAGGLTAAACQ